MRTPALTAIVLVATALPMAMGTPAVAGPSSGHGCPARLGVASTQDWRVRGLSCTAARRIVADVKAIRHSVTRYARTRHCGAQYCIVVRGFRCRPNRQAVSRERCSREQQFVSWSWARPKAPETALTAREVSLGRRLGTPRGVSDLRRPVRSRGMRAKLEP